MKFFDKLPEWILFIAILAAFLVGIVLLAEVYRKFQLLWVSLWLTIPVLAYLVANRKFDPYLTEEGFKSLRVCLMTFAIGMSFIVFFDDNLKAKFGHYFFKGAKFWLADYGDTDDNGNPILAHEFSAPTALGRFVLGSYPFVLFGLCILLPYVLNRSFEQAIRAKKAQRYESGEHGSSR